MPQKHEKLVEEQSFEGSVGQGANEVRGQVSVSALVLRLGQLVVVRKAFERVARCHTGDCTIDIGII